MENFQSFFNLHLHLINRFTKHTLFLANLMAKTRKMPYCIALKSIDTQCFSSFLNNHTILVS